MWVHMSDWGGNWGVGWGFFAAMHILWWLVVVLAFVALIRLVFGRGLRGQRRTEEDRALGILRERYARGEIDKTEFEERKNNLAS